MIINFNYMISLNTPVKYVISGLIFYAYLLYVSQG